MSALQAEPTTLFAPGHTATVSFNAACEAIDRAHAVLREPQSSLRRWRCLSEILAARKAFLNHSTVCTSADGPVAHLLKQKPRLTADVGRLGDDHVEIRHAFDGLIARASRQDGLDISPAEIDVLARRLAKHKFTSTGLAFEWANRDIGGEG
jgi:hypothetical protein